MPGQIKLLTIEDTVLRSMIADPRFQEVLPCLAAAKAELNSVKSGQKNCNRCKSEKNRIASNAIAKARACVANARGGALSKLKQLLNAKDLRVVSRNARGQTVKWTI